MVGRSGRIWRIALGVIVAGAVLPAVSAAAGPSAAAGETAITASCGAGAQSTTSFAGPVADVVDSNTLGSAADLTASIDWGDSSSSNGMVNGGGGSYVVSGNHSYGSTGTFTITATVADGAASSSTSCTVLVYAYAPGGGAFVVGDQSARGTVTFWGAQWWKVNDLSGGSAPAAFKGFALNAAALTCDAGNGSFPGWSTDPGNSAPPPAGPLPDYMAVIVASSIGKSGSRISGNTVRAVVVRTNPGYEGNPGHAGTGTVITTVALSGCDL